MANAGLSLSKAVTEAQKRHWTLTNTFRVEIHWNETGGLGNLGQSELGWSNKVGNDFNLNVISVTVPDLTSQSIEVYTADNYRIAQGKCETKKFTITIRDQDYNFYHRLFSKLFLLQQKLYFDDYKSIVSIYKLPDYEGEEEKLLYRFKECMVESVGGLKFDNDADADIASFDVEFKSILYGAADVV